MLWPLKWVLGKLAAGHARRVRQQFHEMTRRPQEVQHAHLFAQIQRERETGFGREHGFDKIKNLKDFRKHVPICTYDYFAPYIERVKNGDFEALFHRQKVLMFAMTSGTTATRKFIPVTERYLADYRRGWLIWGIHMFESHKELWFKTMVQLCSNWDEFRTPAGVPCGSISGLTTQAQKYIVRKTYLLPKESVTLKDVQAKYYLTWRLGLVRGMHILLSANPSTMVNLARFGDEFKEQLIRDVRDGTIAKAFPMPEGVWRAERKRLLPNPARAAELEEIVRRTDRLLPKDAFPQLGLIGNWTGGSVGAYMRHYPEYYGSPAVRDIGLIASEGRMTIPIADNTPGGILEITSSFFEFVPVAEIDSPKPTVLESHELREGHDYYILLTTSSGLYRYNIYDVVRCVGWAEKTPILAFLNKGSSFSNLTGEKVSEYQVAQAVERSLTELGWKLTAFTMAPCWDDVMPFYSLFIEQSDLTQPAAQGRALAETVERHLRALNSEYQEKRDTRRLGPMRLQLLPPGTWQQWDREQLAKRGGTAEQYKHPCLIPDTAFQATMPVFGEVSAA